MSFTNPLRVRLVGVKSGRMENRTKKIWEILGGREVWLGWFWGKKRWNPTIFSPNPPLFSPHPPIGEKMQREKELDWKYPSTPYLSPKLKRCYYFFFFISFFFPSLLNVWVAFFNIPIIHFFSFIKYLY